jgi:hypothetical protein
MSLEESEDAIAPAAVAAPVPEQTENDQPPVALAATAVPAATAIPASTSEIDTEDESEVNTIENNEVEENKVEEKVEEKPESEPQNPESTRSPPPLPPPKQEYVYPPNPIAPQLPYPSFLYNTFLMLFILIGMVFILIGGILSGTAIISKNIDVYGASIITISLGLFTLATFLILAALFRNDLNNQIRLGLLIVGAFSILGLVYYSAQG